MSEIDFGPLRFLIGKWESEGFQGENRAPDPDRKVENTKFRQEMNFEPIPEIENHEQVLQACDIVLKRGKKEMMKNLFMRK